MIALRCCVRSLITGGSSPAEKARASKWDQKEYDALKAAHDSLARELDVLGEATLSQDQVSALRTAVSSKHQEMRTSETDVELTRTKVGKLKEESSHVTGALEQANDELRKLEVVVRSAEAELDEMQRTCDAEEDLVFQPFAKSLGIASVREYEEKHLRKARERDADILRLKQQKSKLEARIQFECRKDFPAAVAKLRETIDRDIGVVSRLAALQATSEAASLQVEQAVANVEAEANLSKQAQEKLTQELKSLKKELRVVADRVGAANVKLTQLENDIEQQRSQRQRVFQRARLEKVNRSAKPPNARLLWERAV
jgi:structural maintenance of chromosome 1